jgi:hypothetical protein
LNTANVHLVPAFGPSDEPKFTKRKLWVYVAGPMTQGNSYFNVRVAVQYGEQLRKKGYIPIIPHLSAFWSMIGSDATYEDWMTLDFELISRCDVLLRIPGYSPGADREVEFAKSSRIPVVTPEAFELTAPK